MINFFTDIHIFSSPMQKDNIVVSADDIYFKKFGKIIIHSCIKSNNNIHIHVVNPTYDTLLEFKNYDVNRISFSYEYLDISYIHNLLIKTYYYVSRYFITNFLFENYNLNNTFICDIDMFFYKKINLPDDKEIGIFYSPEKNSPWKQSSAGFVFINKNKKHFLKNLISNYLEKIISIDYVWVENNLSGLEKANLVGLDQVCLTEELQKFLDDPTFLNLNTVSTFISKNDDPNYVAWNLIRAKKDPNFNEYIKNRF